MVSGCLNIFMGRLELKVTNKTGMIVSLACFMATLGFYGTLGCHQPATESSSEVMAVDSGAQITGRTSMGPRDGYQCQPYYSYTGDEQVEGRWIAGLDGKSFGSLYDAEGPKLGQLACNNKFTITYNGKCENFIVMDRIWENDGAGEQTYSDKGNSLKKINGKGPGYSQMDIANGPFQSLFQGKNPAVGSYHINPGATCPTGGVTSQSPSQPVTGSPGMQGASPPNAETSSGFNAEAGFGAPNSLAGTGVGMPTTTQSPVATTSPQPPLSTPDFPNCINRDYCSEAWGWHKQGEHGCNAGSPGWIQDQNGCSCRC